MKAKHDRSGWQCVLAVAVLWLGVVGARAASWAEWRQRQEVAVEGTGLFKLSLPPETLEAARPGLEDLRVADSAGTRCRI